LKKEEEKIQTGSIIDRVFAPSKEKKDLGAQEDVSKIIKEWLDPKHVDKKTRYTPQQVVAVSILGSLAETYKIKTLQRFLKAFKTAKLSEGGKSAEELENILKARIATEEDGQLKGLARFLE
jgi:hypothetical protein